MKIFALKFLIVFLQVATLWHLRRAIHRNAVLAMVKVYRAAYSYAMWVDQRTTGERAISLNTHIGTITYQRPLTMKKLVEAYRDRR